MTFPVVLGALFAAAAVVAAIRQELADGSDSQPIELGVEKPKNKKGGLGR